MENKKPRIFAFNGDEIETEVRWGCPTIGNCSIPWNLIVQGRYPTEKGFHELVVELTDEAAKTLGGKFGYFKCVHNGATTSLKFHPIRQGSTPGFQGVWGKIAGFEAVKSGNCQAPVLGQNESDRRAILTGVLIALRFPRNKVAASVFQIHDMALPAQPGTWLAKLQPQAKADLQKEGVIMPCKLFVGMMNAIYP